MQLRFLIAIPMFLFVVLVASALVAKPRKPARLAQGAWGGQHITVDVGEASATIEFDCAHGRIDGPLVVNRRGRFDLKGTFAREHGGPTRIDEKSSGQPARYSGWTNGRRMTLTVTVDSRKESVVTFNLTHGVPGRIFKCR